MLNIKVTYFLSDAGKNFFTLWFNKVAEITGQQDGFIDIDSQLDDEGNPTLYLNFECSDKLNLWRVNPLHDILVSEIESYFVKPREATIIET